MAECGSMRDSAAAIPPRDEKDESWSRGARIKCWSALRSMLHSKLIQEPCSVLTEPIGSFDAQHLPTVASQNCGFGHGGFLPVAALLDRRCRHQHAISEAAAL